MLCERLGIQMCNTLLNTVSEVVNKTEIHSYIGLLDFFYINILNLANRVMLVKASSEVTQ